MASSTPSATVAVITYRRPAGLARLLDAFRKLHQPSALWSVSFLVVDNDPEGSARDTLKAYAGIFEAGDLVYTHEPNPGIPAARNHALDHAKTSGADVLCFIDDDEIPAPDWLSHLLNGQQKDGCHLGGGPTRVFPVAEGTSGCQRFVLASMVAGQLRGESKIAAAHKAGRRLRTLGTGNWICDVKWASTHQISFDEKLRYTGGSDTAFLDTAISLGAKVGWFPDAICYEHYPLERISLRAAFRRGYSHALAGHQFRKVRATPRALATAFALIAFGFILLVVPLRGIASLATGAQRAGTGVGTLAGFMGRRSSLYVRTP